MLLPKLKYVHCSLPNNGKNVDEKEIVNIKQTELKLLRVTLDHPRCSSCGS